MKKIFKSCILLLIVCLISNLKVSAFQVEGSGSLGSGFYRIEGNFATSYKRTKSNNPVVLLCTSHDDKSPADEDTTCSLATGNKAWSQQVAAGVAAIIEAVNGKYVNDGNDAPSDQYMAAVYAINQFLYEKNAGGSSLNNTEDFKSTSLYTTYSAEYLRKANEAYNAAVKPTVTISDTKLTFVLKDDKYVSNSVSITSSQGSTLNVTSNKGEVISEGDGKYSISIDISDLEMGKKLDISLTATATKSIDYAENYSCGTYQEGGVTKNYQSVTPVNYKTTNLTATSSISGEIEIKTSLTIKKVNDRNQFLPGVVLKVECEENDYSETFTTTDEEIVIENLKFGKYVITEVSTPEGYIKLKEPKEITISETSLTETIILSNSLNKVEISKISSADSKLLSGAVLQIQDKDGNVVLDADGKKYEWTTKDSVHVIYGLKPGTYYLVEISAPEGYELNEEKIEFIVDGEKEFVKVKMSNDIEVKVPDTLSSKSTLLIAISMFDIALGIGIITYVKKNKTSK